MDPARHQVVEASAGTGKTYLIEHRVVDLLLSTDALVEQILVVTFTEKATAELRFRIRRLLEAVEGAHEHSAGPDDPHWLIDAEARHKLTDALLGFDRAAIHTIHGFCQRVLTENAFSSRRLFAQTQIAAEAAFAEAFKAALRERFAREDDHQRYLAAWYRSGRSVDDLERLLFRCGSQNGRLVPEYDEDELTRRLGEACAALPRIDDEDAWKAALKRAGVTGSTRSAVLRRLVELRRCLDGFAQRGDVAAFLSAFERTDRALSRSGPRLLDYLGDKLAGVGPGDGDLGAAAAVVAALDRAVVPLAAAVAQRFLPEVMTRMDADKNRRGHFDFHDMLRLVWQSLEHGDAEAVRTRLRERYHYALIDEFQDTDELQWKIFQRLFLDGEDRPLCIIGDPKQAIYGFRGADVHTYLEARRQVRERGGQATNLTDNYRSTDALVRAYNAIFADDFFTGEIGYEHPVRAATALEARDATGAVVAPVCVLHVEPEQGKLKADELRQTLLTQMASEIRRLLFEPEGELLVGGPGALAPITAGDVFVLTRTTAESNEVAERLREAGIPCAIYKQEGLFQTREAREVRDLLCGIAEPRKRAARFQAWNTRFFGATLTDLPHLARLPETHPFVARLYEWKALADRLQYEPLFSRILEQSGIIERELFLESSERALTNFLHLFELLLEEVMRSRCELHELVQRLERWIADTADDLQADERNIQRMESESSAVQVMTIHRSKGLEAKVVFLYGGFGGFGGDEVQVYHDGGERLVQVGPAGRDVAALVARESASEDQRLLYVAITRAVARLYLPYVAPADYASSISGAYAPVNRRLEGLVARARSGDPEVAPLFAIESIGPGRPVRPPPRAGRALLADWRPPAALLAPAPAAIDYTHACAHRAGFVVTSYTSMKDAGSGAANLAGATLADDPAGHESGTDDLGAAGAAGRGTDFDLDLARARAPVSRVTANDFKADHVITGARAGEDELPGGAQSGVFLHRVLEHLPFDSARDVDLDTWRALPEVERVFADALLRYSRDPRHLAYSERVIYHCLTTPLHLGRKVTPGLAWCERLVREMEFLYPIPSRSDEDRAPDQAGDQGDDSDGAPAQAAPMPDPGGDIRLERGYIKGFIDLLFEYQGRVYVLDWKSDILADYGARAVARHVYRAYQLQAQLYTVALARMLELGSEHQHRRRFGGLVYCFIRGMGGPSDPVDEEGRQPALYFARPSFEQLAALERDLEDRDDYG